VISIESVRLILLIAMFLGLECKHVDFVTASSTVNWLTLSSTWYNRRATKMKPIQCADYAKVSIITGIQDLE